MSAVPFRGTMKIQAREMRYFLALSEALNFTEAAKFCRVSQPALTKTIQSLESKVGGGPLVNRERGRTHLTALGQAMKPHFETVLAELEAAQAAASDYLASRKPTVRFGFWSVLEGTPACDIFCDLLTAMSDHTVTIVSSSECDLARRLDDGDLDFVITTSESLTSGDQSVVDLFPMGLDLAMAAGHVLASRPEIKACELESHCLVNAATFDLSGLFAGAAPVRQPCHEGLAASHALTWSLLGAGHGVALIPSGLDLPNGIAARPIDGAAASRRVCLVSHASWHDDGLLERLTKIAASATHHR